MTDEAPVLRVRGLCKEFDGFQALKGVDLEFGKGLLIGLIGPNGCGKSTMMKCISRIHPQTEGTIEVAGKDVSTMKAAEVAKLVANVPAEAGQTFGISVMDMVMLGRYPFVDRIWWENPEDERITREALRTFGIDHLQEPKLMLVDEPTSHLDMTYKLQVMEYLQKMARSEMTVMVAEHDISLMARYCDMCVIMKQGEIVAVGDPKEIITEQLIKDVYEVEARVGLDADGEIYVLPKRYIEGSL